MTSKQDQIQSAINSVSIPEPDPSLFSPITNGLTQTNQPKVEFPTQINKIIENDLVSEIKLNDESKNIKK